MGKLRNNYLHRLTIACSIAITGVCLDANAVQPNHYSLGLNAEFSGDLTTAVQEYTLAANAGLGDAKYALGRIYRDQYGDPQASLEWFLGAAQQGNSFAQQALGDIYRYGSGAVSADLVQARHWYGLAAPKDTSGTSAYALSQISTSTEETLQWLLDSAEHGNMDAMSELADAYRDGTLGLDPDLTRSEYWSAQVGANDE